GGVRIAAPTTVPAASRTAAKVAGAVSLTAPERRLRTFVITTLLRTGSRSRKSEARSQNSTGSGVVSHRMGRSMSSEPEAGPQHEMASDRDGDQQHDADDGPPDREPQLRHVATSHEEADGQHEDAEGQRPEELEEADRREHGARVG